MKLIAFERGINYNFHLTFANGKQLANVDLKDLIFNYVDFEGLSTANLNLEWGCLEFQNGMVDIEPKTLYKYAMTISNLEGGLLVNSQLLPSPVMERG